MLKSTMLTVPVSFYLVTYFSVLLVSLSDVVLRQNSSTTRYRCVFSVPTKLTLPVCLTTASATSEVTFTVEVISVVMAMIVTSNRTPLTIIFLDVVIRYIGCILVLETVLLSRRVTDDIQVA